MASILRTGKFLRYFTGITRNLLVNTAQQNEAGNSLLENSACMCSQYQLNFASTAAPKTDLHLERQLKRLDQDVRRIGRISRRDIEEVLEEIRSLRSATSSQSLLVIRCCGNLVPEELPEVRTAMVQEIWKTLNALHVPMDISHYNALLRVYLENEHAFSPTDFLSEIEAKSIEPNRVTYQRLIARYCQQGDIEGATRILEYMREKGLPVNESVFNSLILGHSQANDLESAQGILSVMRQAGLEPSAETYSTLLCCFARHGKIDDITKTLQECEQKEIFLLDKDVLDVVYALAINGHADKVDALLSKLRMATNFNQDAVNVILRLVNKGHEDVGLKILRLMPRNVRPDGQPVDAGIFFIRQLVKVNRPVEKILSICKTMQTEGLNNRALLIATEAGLSSGLINNALPLLHEMKNAGLPIRQHYFWPLFCTAEANQIIDIVRRMQHEFALNPNAETIRDYVIPHLREKNWDKIVTLLRDAGVAHGTAAAAAAFAAINENKLKEAANIMETHRAYYAVQVFRQQLVLALSKCQDYNSFVRIIRQLYDSKQQQQRSQKTVNADEGAAETDELTDSTELTEPVVTRDIVGTLLLDVLAYFRAQRIEVLEKLLPLLVQQGLPLNSDMATRISERLGAELTPKISEQLGQLSSGELELTPSKTNENRKRGLDSLTVEELERFIANVAAKGENTSHLKRFLISACFRSKNLEKTEQVLEQLKAENYNLHTGVHAQLIDLYVHHGKTAEALDTYRKIRATETEFLLDNLKTVRLLDLLLKEERFDEALQLLQENKKPQPTTDGDASYAYMSMIWRILNNLAESGDVQQVNRLFEALVEHNYILPTNVLLGPLIKVHLTKDDIQGAIRKFEEICEKYKSTPWKNELACRLIQKEDAVNLQKLTDLSTNIHGEVNSLYDLVFSFVECGRIRQARKILETPGLRTRPHRIETACERYKNEGLVQPLEGLIEATKDLNHIDRNQIFYNLLLSYAKTEDADKALGLWTKMQEECIAPTDAFLIKLAELLQKQNRPVPFALPNEMAQTAVRTQQQPQQVKTSERTAPPRKSTTTTTATTATSSTITLFRKAINAGDVDAAIAYTQQLKPIETLNPIDVSKLIELLVRAERLTEASKYVSDLLAQQKHPVLKIFKFYLNKLAATGDVEAMQRLGEQLNDDIKRQVSFDNRLCNAYLNSGKVQQYIQKLTDEIDNAKSAEEVTELAKKFPRGGALGVLSQHAELVPAFTALADKYAAQNHLGPANVLWMHLITTGNEAAAKEIWQKYLSNAPRLMFQRVLQTAREHKNDKLVESVINQLRGSKISEGAIGNAYSCLIDIHTQNNNVERALDTLKTAITDVCLENINRTALLRLKTVALAQNKPFPYEIPEKKSLNNDSSSSQSSSDDDIKPPTPETRPERPLKKATN